MYMQPVGSGNDETFTGIPGHNPTKEVVGPFLGSAALVWPYVDGGVTTLVTSLANNGLVGLTITDVETNGGRPSWGGLYAVKEARAAVLVSPGQCCQLDESATWSAHGFRPMYIDPGRQGVVALHILISNCEFNSPGQYVGLASITVDYTVLGFQHSQKVGVGPYWFKSPDTCPRSGPARAAG